MSDYDVILEPIRENEYEVILEVYKGVPGDGGGTGIIPADVLRTSHVIDNLTSILATQPLSANQGRVLKGLIDQINTILYSPDTTLDEIAEIVAYIKQNKQILDTLAISNIAGLADALSVLTTDVGTAQSRADSAHSLATQADGKAQTHIDNNTPHVSSTDRTNWNSKQIPLTYREEPGAFTLSVADVYVKIRYTGATDITVQVPDTLLLHSEILIRQAGAGTVTLVPATDEVLNGGTKTAGQHSSIFMTKVGPKLFDLTGGVEVFYSPNDFETGTQIERINMAIVEATNKGTSALIPEYDSVENTNVWLIDSAILVHQDTNLRIEGKIKLSDTSRDNFIRSSNCGMGISNISPISNIKIEGVGNVVFEGADNPRATGDGNKTLSLNATRHPTSYGTDINNPEESHLGDWRNNGINLAFVDNFQIIGIHFKDYHSHCVVLERSSNGFLDNLSFEADGFSAAKLGTRKIGNQDGIGIRLGCHDIEIRNCSGITGDDFINIGVTVGSIGAGEVGTHCVSGVIYNGVVDDIYNISINDWANVDAFRADDSAAHRIIRMMAKTFNISGINIQNIVTKNTCPILIESTLPGVFNDISLQNIEGDGEITVTGEIQNSQFTDINYTGSGNALYYPQSSQNITINNVNGGVITT